MDSFQASWGLDNLSSEVKLWGGRVEWVGSQDKGFVFGA